MMKKIREYVFALDVGKLNDPAVRDILRDINFDRRGVDFFKNAFNNPYNVHSINIINAFEDAVLCPKGREKEKPPMAPNVVHTKWSKLCKFKSPNELKWGLKYVTFFKELLAETNPNRNNIYQWLEKAGHKLERRLILRSVGINCNQSQMGNKAKIKI